MNDWRNKLRDLSLRTKPQAKWCAKCRAWGCSCGPFQRVRKKRELTTEQKSARWFKAREKNLQEQIRVLRSKISFWESMNATENLAKAKREMISLKSKLADVKKRL